VLWPVICHRHKRTALTKMSDFIRSTIAHSPLGEHLWHIVLLGAWIPIFAVIVLFEKLKAHRRERRINANDREFLESRPETINVEEAKPNGSAWLQATALASLSAALVHAAVMPDHFRESVIYGLFFVGASLGQLTFGILILTKPSRRLVTAGIFGSALMIVLWLITRTLGVPIGPDNGATESFGLLDALASSFEAVTVIVGILALRAWTPTPAWRWSKWTPTIRLAVPICIAGTLAASVLSSRS
jgi:hypothetical protein